MKILRARLSNYRGTRERQIEFGPGVTVIQGPNEVGKSSIAEALDLIFRFKDSSKHRAVKGTIPVDRDVSPEMEFDLESGPYRFTYTKRFGKGSRTELVITEPRPENLTGDAAHERAEQILAETLDVNLWRALQVDQGVGVNQAVLQDSRALGRALDQSAGPVADVADDGALFDRAYQEYSRYFTQTGRHKTEMTAPAARIEELEDALRKVEQQQAALQQDVDEHARLTAQLQAVEEGLPAITEKVGERDKAWQAVSQIVSNLERADADLERRTLAQTQLIEARKRRDELQRDLDDKKGKIAGLRTQLADLAAPLEALRRDHAAAKEEVEKVRAALQAAEDLHALRDKDETYLRAKLEAERLDERHRSVASLRETAREDRSLLETIKVTDDRLEELVDAEGEVRQCERQLQEAGPQVRARALKGLTVKVDGEAVALGAGEVEERSVGRPTTITVPDQIEITVSPGTSSDDLQAALASASRELAALLAGCDVVSVKAAQEANLARKLAEQRLAEVDSRMAEALRDLTLEQLEAKRDSCVAVVRQHEEARGPEPGMAADLTAARELAAAAEAEVKSLRRQEKKATDQVSALADKVLSSSGAETRAQALIDSEEQAREALHKALEEERQRLSDEDLGARIVAAQDEVDRARIVADALRKQRNDANPEQTEARLESARAELKAAQEERATLREDLKGVSGKLELQREAGLFEEAERLRSDLEHLRAEYARLTRRAEAAGLLFDTIGRHRDAARRRYLAPLTSRIEALGKMVFDSTLKVALADDLTIESRTLSGKTIPFGDLSKGAQEQLGLIVRLAVATLVAEQEGVPLILDDTLGYSDAGRLETMAATIGRAAQQCQIVILTCSPDRFRGIPGARIERLAYDN